MRRIGLSARQENRIAMVVAIGGASCTAPVASSEADYSFNAKGLDSQPAEPRFPAPISGKDIQDRGESWPR
jgi:hypothetical protein